MDIPELLNILLPCQPLEEHALMIAVVMDDVMRQRVNVAVMLAGLEEAATLKCAWPPMDTHPKPFNLETGYTIMSPFPLDPLT